MLMRVGGLLVASVAVVGVIGAALVAIAPWSRTNSPLAAEATPRVAPVAAKATPPARTTPASRPVASRATPQVSPVIAEGRTDLGDSVYVERAGGEVTVHFDNSMLRTRFEDKFERTVRSTLPRIYGTEAQVALDSVSPGALVRGDLINELPTKGIELSLGPGRSLLLYPMTRQGLDGPLVVAYRAVPRS